MPHSTKTELLLLTVIGAVALVAIYLITMQTNMINMRMPFAGSATHTGKSVQVTDGCGDPGAEFLFSRGRTVAHLTYDRFHAHHDLLTFTDALANTYEVPLIEGEGFLLLPGGVGCAVEVDHRGFNFGRLCVDTDCDGKIRAE